MNKYEILIELIKDLFQTATDNLVRMDSEPLFETINDSISNEDYKSDLGFATLCNTIGYLQAKIEYNNK